MTPKECKKIIDEYNQIDLEKIKKLKHKFDEVGIVTIKDYLVALLSRLWREQSEFSGKRPFGNSGWEWEIYIPLIKAEVLKADLDENGYIENFPDAEQDKGFAIIMQIIQELK